MAKEWAKSFYKSRAWRQLRAEILRRDMFTCEECGARATEVHHEIELTPGNIDDPAIALNPKLLHSLCHDCHTAITQGNSDCAEGYFFQRRRPADPPGRVRNTPRPWGPRGTHENTRHVRA